MIGVALLIGQSSAGADPLPGRTLLATGDAVPGLGRIGRLGAEVRAIAADGSVLLDLSLSDRTRGVAWADGDRVRFVWRAADGAAGPAIAAREVAASDDGTRVFALGDPDPVTRGLRALYALAGGDAQRLLVAGERTVEGWTIAGFSHLGGVADDGSAAVLATLMPPSAGGDLRFVLLSVSSAGARIVAEDSPRPDPSRPFTVHGIEPLSTLPGGAVLFQARIGENDSGVFRGDATGLQPILISTAPGPSGEPLSDVQGLAASADGEVLARTCAIAPKTGQPACTIYRSRRGQWLTVRPARDLGPDGRLSVVTRGSLNTRGDVVFDGFRPDAGGNLVLYYPAGSAARVVGEEGYHQRGINDRGQVALRGPTGVARWMDGRLAVLVTPRTIIADGARPLAGGIFWSCLADDGRVGAYVAVDGEQGAWLCVDDLGPHLMRGNSPDGGEHCAFTDGAMVVDGSERVTHSDGRRTTDLLAAGAPLGDGQRVDVILSAAVNPTGSLAAVVDAGERRLLVRVDPGGTPRVLDATAGGALDAPSVVAVGVADNGTVLALVFANVDTTAVVAVTPDGETNVPFRDDASGTHVLGFDVAGNRLLLALERYPAGATMQILDLDTGQWRDRLPAGVLAPGELREVIDTSRAGDVLYVTFADPAAYWLLTGDERRLLAVDQNEGPKPQALRAAGDILSWTETYTVGAQRTVLSSTGGRIAGRCVAPRATSSPPDDDGCAIGAPHDPNPWPFLGALMGVALLAWQRRAAARTRR